MDNICSKTIKSYKANDLKEAETWLNEQAKLDIHGSVDILNIHPWTHANKIGYEILIELHIRRDHGSTIAST